MKRVWVSQTRASANPSRPTIFITLKVGGRTSRVSAFIDSGADSNFVSADLVKSCGIPVQRMPVSIAVQALDGHLLNQVEQRTLPVQLLFPGGHSEEITLHVLDCSPHPIILGFPWLQRHQPILQWGPLSVVGWGKGCDQTCLSSSSSCLSLRTCLSPSPLVVTADLTAVPAMYHDVGEVFNKARAVSLPPHRTYDCAIELLPGSQPQRGRLYSLSRPETEAMNQYINDSLAAGIIRPSSSPAGAGFFFVGKKDGS